MHTEISGITIEIIKKNIKNMHLSVLPADLGCGSDRLIVGFTPT